MPSYIVFAGESGSEDMAKAVANSFCDDEAREAIYASARNMVSQLGLKLKQVPGLGACQFESLSVAAKGQGWDVGSGPDVTGSGGPADPAL